MNNYGRREGFNDNEPKVESYGAGTGSGANDLANTGLGGYGNQQGGNAAGDVLTGSGGGFSGSQNTSQSDSSLSGDGFGSGSDEQQGTYGAGPGAGATDPANTGLGGYSGNADNGPPDTERFGAGNRYGTDDLSAQLEAAHREGREQAAQGDMVTDRDSGGQPGFGDQLRGPSLDGLASQSAR